MTLEKFHESPMTKERFYKSFKRSLKLTESHKTILDHMSDDRFNSAIKDATFGDTFDEGFCFYLLFERSYGNSKNHK